MKFMNIERVLVIGPSGSGKTYISKNLQLVHINAVDADSLKGLCKWTDESGYKIKFKKSADKTWLKHHHFIWDRNFLKKYLEKQKQIYLFGLSQNVFDMVDLFDKVYYLHLRPKLVDEHLRSKKRKNPWGHYKKQRDLTVKGLGELKTLAKKHKCKIIKANVTPDELFHEIE